MTLDIVGYLNVEIDGVCNKSQDAGIGIRDPSTMNIHQALVTQLRFLARSGSTNKMTRLDMVGYLNAEIDDLCNSIIFHVMLN